MKIIFFGSGEIAVPSLNVLLENDFEVLCVITAPDSKKGRRLLPSVTAVKDFAKRKNLNLFQPVNPSMKESIEYIKKFGVDIFVVFSYGKILCQDLLRIPKLFALNIHASLLPKYRGAAPINWALINGESKTGISIIKMNEKLDEGDIILQKEIEIDYFDNVLTLEQKLAQLASLVLLETLSKIRNNDVSFIKQDNREANYAPKLKRENGRVNWNKTAEQIRNQVRGCFSWPGAFTLYNKNMIKIWEAEVMNLEEQAIAPGTIISLEKEGIVVSTKDKFLLIKELQFSSGRRLRAWQFLQGHALKKGEKFS